MEEEPSGSGLQDMGLGFVRRKASKWVIGLLASPWTILAVVMVVGVMVLFGAASQSNADCSSTGAVAGGKDNTEIAYNYLMKPEFGLEPFQASAIVGNFIHESASDPLNTEAVSPIGAYGIAQWYAGRLTALKNHQFRGLPVNDINRQLDFLRQELFTYQRKALDAVRSATTIEQATTEFERIFEVSGDVGSYPRRIENAKKVLAKYGQNSPGTTAVSCVGGTGNGSLDAVLAKITEYAVPEYHGAPYTTMKESYRKAVDEASSKGIYVGGDSYPGIDCGGFVSLVMKNSGADPDYNKYNANTTYQKLYMDQHPEKYQPLGAYGSMQELYDKARPGDIAINAHHTYFYVGDALGPNWHGDSASASVYAWRTPMASNAYLGSSPRSGGYFPFYWYRPVYR